MARYLVTGGAGFIGSHLVERLVHAGEDVRVLDNFSTGKRENLAGVLQSIDLIAGDLTDPDTLVRAVAGIDFVLHQAALPSVPRSVKDPLATDATNVRGTLQLLLACRDAGVRRVVQASSSSVYGNTAVLPKVETLPPAPRSPYAVSKLAAEAYGSAFFHTYGLEVVSLRYFNVFGPRQDPESQYAAVIPRFISAALQGQAPTVFGDGKQTRDFCYIDNVVEANLAACRASPEAAGQAFNIACEQRTSLLELLALLGELLERPVQPQFVPPRPGDVQHSLADIQAARQYLGYEPRVLFGEGFRRTLASFRDPSSTPPRPQGASA